jgi:hypothetical protein
MICHYLRHDEIMVDTGVWREIAIATSACCWTHLLRLVVLAKRSKVCAAGDVDFHLCRLLNGDIILVDTSRCVWRGRIVPAAEFELAGLVGWHGLVSDHTTIVRRIV